MKAGDFVRVIAGEHMGREGIVVDHERRRDAIQGLLLDSPTKRVMLDRITVPVGHVLVDLQPSKGHWNVMTKSLAAADLVEVSR